MKDDGIFLVVVSNQWIRFSEINFLSFIKTYVYVFTFSHLPNMIKKLHGGHQIDMS
jgi:hypothetical protein